MAGVALEPAAACCQACRWPCPLWILLPRSRASSWSKAKERRAVEEDEEGRWGGGGEEGRRGCNGGRRRRWPAAADGRGKEVLDLARLSAVRYADLLRAPVPPARGPVVFHGGGFVMGSAESVVMHRWLNGLAAACPAVAVSVDYRLAPEHPVAAAYEDSLAALKWALLSDPAAGAEPWLAAHGDPARVFLAGESAGGNICHNLAMHADVRDAGGVKGVVLIHPWFWGKERIGGEPPWFLCPGAVDDPRMNLTAPGAPGLENLACEKVMVCVAEEDVLRWRGKLYAEAAARARDAADADAESVATWLPVVARRLTGDLGFTNYAPGKDIDVDDEGGGGELRGDLCSDDPLPARALLGGGGAVGPDGMRNRWERKVGVGPTGVGGCWIWGPETIIWESMKNRSPSRDSIGVRFFSKLLKFRVGSQVGASTGVALTR